MHRFLALALVLAVTPLAGCGTGEPGSEAAGAPEPRELARQALRAARAAGSVHYAFDATFAGEGSAPVELAFAGDIGRGRAQADVSVSGNGQSLAGTLLYDGAGFFVRYLGRWYGEAIPKGRAGELERELGSEEAFSGNFEALFDGSVSAGPATDGVPTWAYHGRLDVDGLASVAEAEGHPLNGEQRDQLEELAEQARFTLLVGAQDMLPRALKLDLSGDLADLAGVGGPGGGSFSVTLSGSFSRWGEPVQITAPDSYAPLHELFGEFFPF
ncbi:MAG TPA: hypothetical protein VHK22_05915 [Gaiellaceae bacterium]|nr:hypothetical protein [Gaiellaceae bacterium]